MAEADFIPCTTQDLPDLVLQDVQPTEDERPRMVFRSDEDGGPELLNARQAVPRAAFDENLRWNNGATLRIAFQNGSATEHQEIVNVAPEWTKYANLNFQFVGPQQQAEIRILFANKNESAIGRSSMGQNPSMWLENLRPGTLDYFRAVILHEFGHAIGLHHEHQSPASPLEWNWPALRAKFPMWNDGMIQHNIIRRVQISSRHHTRFDHESIMLYAFPASLTLNRIETRQNYQLSELDKVLISQEYPGRWTPSDGNGGAQPDAGQPNADRPTDAGELVVNGRTKEIEVRSPGQKFFFKLVVETAGKVKVQATGAAEISLELFGPDGANTEVDRAGPAKDPWLRPRLQPGEYRLEVLHYRHGDAGKSELTASALG